MNGLCGYFVTDRQARPKLGDLAVMIESLGAPAAPAISVGQGVMAAQAKPGYVAGIAHNASTGPIWVAFCGTFYGSAGRGGAPDIGANLLARYVSEGIAFPKNLLGEFAISVWDGRSETLHVVTDRFRVVPVFYYSDGSRLAFATRVASLRACPQPLNLSIDPQAIVQAVGSSFIPTPGTIYREIKKLEPGHVLTWHAGAADTAPYWDINFLNPSTSGEAELARELKSCFSEAILDRYRADEALPIGTFLSGGIDSSTITGILTQLSGGPVKSFSVGFQEQPFNEISYARTVAAAFKTEHHEYFVSPSDVHDAIPVLLEALDEPFGNSSAIPTYFCAKLAREHGIGVMYAGDGGDELFGGNERYATQRLFEYYHQIPRSLRRSLVEPMVATLANGAQKGPLVLAMKYIRRASLPNPQRLYSYGFFNTVPMESLFEDGFLSSLGRDHDPYAPINLHYFNAPAERELDRQLYIDLKLIISDNDLFKVTRMTECAGARCGTPSSTPGWPTSLRPSSSCHQDAGTTPAVVLQEHLFRPSPGRDHKEEETWFWPSDRRLAAYRSAPQRNDARPGCRGDDDSERVLQEEEVSRN